MSLGKSPQTATYNAAWAIAKAGQLDVQLFSVLAQVAIQCVVNFNA